MKQVGIVGCGNISGIYLKNIAEKFTHVTVVSCTDIDTEKGRQVASEWGITFYSFEDMLQDQSVDIVLNLTTPKSHYEVGKAVLEAKKHLYGEKPLAVELKDGLALIELSKKYGVRIGSAPDTFLGAGIQTAKKLLIDGWIGKPVSAHAHMVCHGHESWHPDPAFYYAQGGGPLFDMGPYYLTALIELLGEATAVYGMTSKAYEERLITSKPRYGQIINVEVPTHVMGLIQFGQGAIAHLVTSFDVWHSSLPFIELHGTEGSLSLGDPNTFGGPLLFRGKRDTQWREIPLLFDYQDNARGLGIDDMANCIETGIEHRAHGERAFHVLQIIHALHSSAETGIRHDFV